MGFNGNGGGSPQVLLPKELEQKIADVEDMLAGKTEEAEILTDQTKANQKLLAQQEADIEANGQQMKEILADITDCQEKLEEYQTDTKIARNGLEAVNAKLKAATEQLDKMLADTLATQKDHEAFKVKAAAEKQALEKDLADMRAALVDMKNAVAKLDLTRQNFEILTKKFTDLSVLLDSLEQKKVGLEKGIVDLQDQVSKAEAATNEQLTKLGESVSLKQQELVTVESQLSEAVGQLKIAQDDYTKTKEQCEQELADLEQAKEAFAVHVRQARIKYPSIKV